MNLIDLRGGRLIGKEIEFVDLIVVLERSGVIEVKQGRIFNLSALTVLKYLTSLFTVLHYNDLRFSLLYFIIMKLHVKAQEARRI